MSLSPEISPSPESLLHDWQPFSLTRQGEQRFGRIILGSNLPIHFEANVKALNELTRKLVIPGDIAIVRKKATEEVKSPMVMAGFDNGTATANIAVTLDEPEPTQEFRYDRQAKRHTISLDFDQIRVQATQLDTQHKRQAEAQLIQAEIVNGMRSISLRDLRRIEYWEFFQTLEALFLVRSWIQLLEALGEGEISEIAGDSFDFLLVSIFYLLISRYAAVEEREQTMSKTLDATRWLQPRYIVRNTTRLVGLSENYLKPTSSLVRPAQAAPPSPDVL